MRLSEKEINSIKSVFAEEIKSEHELKLFGSRVDDKKLGGDIDLLLVVMPENLQSSRDAKYRILNRLYEKIGEQKIDIVIVTPDLIKRDEFLSQITGLSL